jgi:16S rRNA (guanine527-N7)-methyltransferase
MPERGLANSLQAGLRQLGFSEAETLVPGLLAYLDLLQRWNRSYNLTAIRDPREMVSRHLLDSLAVLHWVAGPRLLDAGSGAGLPGLPLAMARPEMQVTLLDSVGKKIRFLNHAVRELGLKNVIPLQARLESFHPQAPFDTIISRAFSELAAFARAARHLAAGAQLLAMKGRFPGGELDDLPDWVRVESIEKLTVPGLQEDRHLVIMSVIP